MDNHVHVIAICQVCCWDKDIDADEIDICSQHYTDICIVEMEQYV